MEKKNYKDDFTLLLHLYVKAESGEYVEIGFPTWDWRAKFYTTNKANAYEASFIGGEMHNCAKVDDKVQVVFNNHRLLAGVLRCEFTSLVPSVEYPDGNERVVVVGDLGVTLTKEPIADDDKIISASIVVPFIVGTNIEQEFEQIKGGFLQLQSDVSQLRGDVAQAQSEVKQAQSKVEQVQSTTSELAKDLEDTTQKVAEVAEELSATSELANKNKTEIVNAQSVANLNTEHLEEVDNRLDALESQSGHSGIQIVTEYPVSGDGMHMIMDDKGLKAVTIWENKKGYRRFVYNRDPVVYIETPNDDQVIINGELVSLSPGSNYIEVDSLTTDTKFYWDENNDKYPPCGQHITSVVIKTKLPSDLSEQAAEGNLFGLGRQKTKIKNLEISITSDVIKIVNLLSYCSSLEYVNCGAWDLSKISMLSGVFNNCKSLVEINNLDTANIQTLNNAFYECINLQHIGISKWDLSKLVNAINAFFKLGSNLTEDNAPTIDVSNFNPINLQNSYCMFDYIGYTKIIGLENWTCENLKTAFEMFGHVKSIKHLDLSNWKTSALTTCNNMFISCINLEYLDLSQFNMSKVTDANRMFDYCGKLTTLIFPNLGTIPSGTTNFGLNTSPLNKESLDGIFSYDRVANGLNTLTVQLSEISRGYLSESDIAAITAKGYTIA